MRYLRIILTILALCSFCFAGDQPNDPVQPLSVISLEWLMGDLQQQTNTVFSASVAYGQPTNNLAQTNYGVWGGDEGPVVKLSDNRMFFAFGDTVGVVGETASCTVGTFNKWCDNQNQNSGGLGLQTYGGYGGSSVALGSKALGLMPASGGNVVDPFPCIGNGMDYIDTQLSLGNTTPAASYSGCPKLTYIVNTTHAAANIPAYATPQFPASSTGSLGTGTDGVTGLTIVAGREPTALIDVGTTLYEVQVGDRSGNAAVGQYMPDAILAIAGTVATPLVDTAISQTRSTEFPWSRIDIWSSAPNLATGTATIATGANTVNWVSGTAFSSYMCTGGSGCTGSYNLIFTDGSNKQEYTLATFIDNHHMTISTNALASGTVNFSIMENQDTNTGKFLESACQSYDPTTVWWQNSLPVGLRTVSNVVICWGASYAYRQSNIYLLAIDGAALSTITYTNGNGTNGASGGISQAYYLTALDSSGGTTWTQSHEEQAIPLLHSISHNVQSKFVSPNYNIGEHSVRYSPGLKRFVMMYGSAETGGIWMRTAAAPWGPWSTEVNVLGNSGGSFWFSRMVHINSINPDFNITLPGNSPLSTGCGSATGGICTNVIYDQTSSGCQMGVGSGCKQSPFALPGNWYAPQLWPTEHVSGNTTTLFFHVSMFDWYGTTLFAVTMQNPGTTLQNATISNLGSIR